MGRYASQHGVSSVAAYFSQKFKVKVSTSTILSIKKDYLLHMREKCKAYLLQWSTSSSRGLTALFAAAINAGNRLLDIENHLDQEAKLFFSNRPIPGSSWPGDQCTHSLFRSHK